MTTTSTLTFTVKETETAQSVGSGGLPVLSTPHMIAYMEHTAWKAVENELDDVQTTVGTAVDIKHLAPTDVGKEVEVTAMLTASTEKTLTFHVEARADGRLIGEGTHQRAVITVDRFLESVK